MEHRTTTPPGRIGFAHRLIASATNYQLAMVSDLIAAPAFLIFGLHRFVGPQIVAGALVLVGFVSCGLLEYAVHRWILHGPPSLARRGHAHHHAEPAALIATPLFIVVTAALAIGGLLGLIGPAGPAALLVFGLYARYNYFALVHHWEHHHRPAFGSNAYWRRLERLHDLHHRRPGVNFGISTTVWDRAFGTFQPASEQTNRAGVVRDHIAG